VKTVVTLLLKDEGRTDEEAGAITKLIDAKLGAFHGHVVSEKEAKLASLDSEKKAELAKKSAEAEVAKKAKKAKAALAHAKAAALKAQALANEAAGVSA